jgi:hypothetical protein
MNRMDACLQRLPPIYNIDQGSLLFQFMALFATSMAAYDEDMNRLQRSHWIDTAFDREDLIKLGALFDIQPASWEPDDLYRARLKATIAARLRGAVTRDVLEFVLVSIIDGAQKSRGTRYFELPASIGSGRSVFHTGPTDKPMTPAFIEYPKQRRRSETLINNKGLLRSLGRFTLNNKGLHPVAVQGVIRGVTGRMTTVPVIVNLTNGQVLAYIGDLPCGYELQIGADENGEFTAGVNDRDVRDRFYTGKGFVPGEDFTPVLPDPEPQPLMLERGENLLWYFSLAIFDEKILGAGVYGMPAVDLQYGRYAEKDNEQIGTLFDKSLFEQPYGVSLDLWWDEDVPARFVFEIPCGVVRRDAHVDGDLEADRVRLFALLQQTVNLLRAAGVDGRVQARALNDSQVMKDRVRILDPTMISDEMRMESRLSGLSALFDTSALDGSRFA